MRFGKCVKDRHHRASVHDIGGAPDRDVRKKCLPAALPEGGRLLPARKGQRAAGVDVGLVGGIAVELGKVPVFEGPEGALAEVRDYRHRHSREEKLRALPAAEERACVHGLRKCDPAFGKGGAKAQKGLPPLRMERFVGGPHVAAPEVSGREPVTEKEDGDENLLFDIETSDNTVVPDDSAAPEGEEEEKAGDAVEPGDGRTDDETDETDDWMKELFGEETSDDETGDEETKEPGQTESEEQQTESEAQQTEGEDDGEEKDDNWFFDIFEQDETDTASQPTGEENDEWDPGIDETGHDEEGDMENPMAADESGEEIDTERPVDADEPDDLDEADDTANDGSEDLKEDEKEEDGDLFDENEENEDGTDGSAGSAPEISFDSDFDSYAVQLTVEGNKVPVSGKLVIESEGETVKKTDLSDTSAWGALKSDFGDETVIYVFTGKALPAGSYRISLKDAVFAEADADGLPVPGTETSPVKVTEDVTYEASGLTVSGDSFTAFSEAELNVSVPEGTAYVELSSSDEDVLIVGEYDPESETAALSFEGSGTAVVTAEYYSEDGELLGEDTLEIAVF